MQFSPNIRKDIFSQFFFYIQNGLFIFSLDFLNQLLVFDLTLSVKNNHNHDK